MQKGEYRFGENSTKTYVKRHQARLPRHSSLHGSRKILWEKAAKFPQHGRERTLPICNCREAQNQEYICFPDRAFCRMVRRAAAGVKNNAPCLGCPDRYLGCHSNCEKYKAMLENNPQKLITKANREIWQTRCYQIDNIHAAKARSNCSSTSAMTRYR